MDLTPIHNLLKAIHDAWTSKKFEQLNQLLDADVVFIQPGFKGKLKGREACIESYRFFMNSADLHGAEMGPLELDQWGDTAVASYRIDIDYTIEEERFLESGRDVWVLRKQGGTWRAAWRTLTPLVED
ncbi:MAG: hypothetical protein OHK0039_02460 [Bacteroidia bacterium]